METVFIERINEDIVGSVNRLLDYGGNRAFNLVFGKGHGLDVLSTLKGGILLAGDCAIAELGPALIDRKKREVLTSSGCNNLAETIEGVCAWMGTSFTRLFPMSAVRTVLAISRAVVAGTNSALVPLRPVGLDAAIVARAMQNVRKIESVEAALCRENPSAAGRDKQ